MEEVDEGMSFCREHARKLNLGLIDKCPKCGRYKDVRQKLCPDCNYGRPVAGWKISSRNLEEVDHQDIDKPVEAESKKEQRPSNPVIEDEIVPEAPKITRGEATCPSCGSLELVYKKAFDYYKCNTCSTTFITPVYTYGEAPDRTGEKLSFPQVNRSANVEPRRNYESFPYRREPAVPPRQESHPLYREQPPVRYEPPLPYREQPDVRYEPSPNYWEQPVPPQRVQPPSHREQYWPEQQSQYEQPMNPPRQQFSPPPPAPVRSVKSPGMDFLKRQPFDEKALNARAIGIGQKGKVGWMYLMIILAIVAVIAVLCWVLFNAQISELLGG